MKKNMKKTWNKPTITQLNVSKTAGGDKAKHTEKACNEKDSSWRGSRPCSSS